MITLKSRTLLFVLAMMLNSHLLAVPVARAVISQSDRSSLFIENKGQIVDQEHKPCDNIDFVLRLPGLTVFIGEGTIHYQFIRRDSTEIADVPGMENLRLTSTMQGYKKKVLATTVNRIQVSLLNANKKAELVKDEESNYHENYYLPQCVEGITAYACGKIIYKNVYPNIDWVFYLQDNSLKYDFIVHKGGKVSDIRLKYDGVSSAGLENGALTATTSIGSVTEQAPYVYDAVTKKTIASAFVLEDNILSINCAENSGEIVVDPFISWSTYYGGEYEDRGNAVASKFGYGTFYKVFLAGETNSFDYLFYSSAFQYYHAGVYGDGNFDGYVRAFTSSGMADWATFYGGSGNDGIKTIACDKNGNVYVAGGTSSDTGIATSGHFQTINAGQQNGFHNDYSDGFVTKFDSVGKRLWGTYFGTAGHMEVINGLALDSSNNIFITGHRDIVGGFLAKLDPDATAKLWEVDTVGGLAVICDPQGNVYTGAAKLNNSGTVLWGTQGAFNALAFDPAIIVDSAGNTINGLLYRGGGAGGPGLSTPTGFQPNYTPRPQPPPPMAPPGEDGLIQAINAATGQLYWGTYLGDSADDEVRGLSLTKAGALIAVGVTGSTKNISSPMAIQNSIGGFADAFITVFNQAARQSSSYFGGESYDEGMGIVSNDNDQTFIAGTTYSFSGINPTNSSVVFQPAYRGSHAASINYSDAFITCLYDDAPMRFYFGSPLFIPLRDYCIGDSLSLQLTIEDQVNAFAFNAGNTYTMQLSDSTGSFANPTVLKIFASNLKSVFVPFRFPAGLAPGNNYRLRVITNRPLMISEILNVSLHEYPRPVVASYDSPLCAGDTLKFHVTDTVNNGVVYLWIMPGGFQTSLKEPFVADITLADAGNYRLQINNTGCITEQNIPVVVNSIPEIESISNNSPVCVGDTLKFSVEDSTSGGMSFNWAGPVGFTSAQQNPFINNVQMTASGKYLLTYSRFGCVNKDSSLAVLAPSPAKPIASSNSPVCEGDTLKLMADNVVMGNLSYTWTGPNGYYTQLQTPLRVSSMDIAGTYRVRSKLYNCISEEDSIQVIVKPKPPVPQLNSNSPVKEGTDLLLSATSTPGATYTWTGPNGFNSSEQSPVIKKVTSEASGKYALLVNLDGCTSSGIIVVVVNAVAQTYFNLFPNPNKGSFTIKISLERDQLVPLTVVNEAGQEVYREDVSSSKKLVEHTINMSESLASGMYFVKIRMDGVNKVIPFSVNR